MKMPGFELVPLRVASFVGGGYLYCTTGPYLYISKCGKHDSLKEDRIKCLYTPDFHMGAFASNTLQ